MSNLFSHRSIILIALTLSTGLGIALALPLLANAQGQMSIHKANSTVTWISHDESGGLNTEPVKGAPDEPGISQGCYATFDDGANTYISSDASALEAAVYFASQGDTIKVAGYCKGVLMEHGLTQTVFITKSLTLAGGYKEGDWTSPLDPDTHPTVLDAEGTGRHGSVPSAG